jgi:hypothetical protein
VGQESGGIDESNKLCGRLPGHGAMNTRHLWLRLVAASGLAIDAYVHWNLAPDFDSFVGAGPAHVSQGQLFRGEAVLAAIALLLVLFVDHLLAAVLALVTAAGGLAAVLLYRYADVGAFGPLPDMYDPTWYPEKTMSVIAEAVVVLAALVLIVGSLRDRREAHGSPSGHARLPV